MIINNYYSVYLAIITPFVALIPLLASLFISAFADDGIAGHTEEDSDAASDHQEEQQAGRDGHEHEKADWIGPAIAGTMIAASTITYETFKRRAIRKEQKNRDAKDGARDHKAA